MQEQSEIQYIAQLAKNSKTDLLGCIEDALEQMIKSRNWKTYLTSLDLFTVLRLKYRMKEVAKNIEKLFEELTETLHHADCKSIIPIIHMYNVYLDFYKWDIVKLFEFCRKDIPHLTGHGEETFNALTYGGRIS